MGRLEGASGRSSRRTKGLVGIGAARSHGGKPRMKFLRGQANQGDAPPQPNTTIGVGSSFRGTLMVSGTLRIEGELDGDILNCERLEIGEHGVMRADIEVKEAIIHGRA